MLSWKNRIFKKNACSDGVFFTLIKKNVLKKKEFLFSGVVKKYWKMLRFKSLSYRCLISIFNQENVLFLHSKLVSSTYVEKAILPPLLYFFFYLPVSIKRFCSWQIFAQYFPSLLKPVGLKKIYPYVCN